MLGMPLGAKTGKVREGFGLPGSPVPPPPPKSPAFGRWTVILSVAIHGFVLFGLFQAAAGFSGEDQRPTIIEVDFLSPPAPEPAPEPAAEPLPPAQEAPPPEVAPGPVTPPVPQPEPLAPSPPEPEVRPPPSKPPPPERKARSAPEVKSTASDKPAPVVMAPPAVAPAIPEQNGLLPLRDDSLAAYGRQIWARIERRKPRNIHSPGVATVTFALAADGSLLSATLSAASGVASLDQAALATVSAAAPFPPPPAGASPGQLVFSIPFQFR